MAQFTAANRHKLAGAGEAMPDGSFPIRNRQDLKNAVMAVGRAKDPAAAKAWCIKRATEMHATDLLPKGWGDGDGKDAETKGETKGERYMKIVARHAKKLPQ